MGGLGFLKNAAAPYDHLGLRYIPLGGIRSDSAAAYFADHRVLAVGGSWLAPKALLDAGDWAAITQHAQDAVEMAEIARGRT